ncbi:hypothetical protein E4A47_04455 [Micrococcus flavus]|uniref:HIRAN domain-containing protein n=1 Tax=Micrococcus flavus TaxID=384602 RepID=A0A4Y8X3C4_9MICC|nr:HIRAN domain-containing protein [Micrococcus flavus]MBB4883184.1 hypothetical protein [Micrococcus flavus]TFI03801.1 hypothetical protein E4A47_04455 [Micrococcus flavus]GGK43054.1 hypothetical protein GCM10007073_07620 [Micrococcus flavus]
MPETTHYELPHGGYNGVELVGEFAYKEALLRALPRLPADGAPAEATVPVEIVPEPDNPYDRRAVSVRAEGQVIGYLSRELAADYHLPIKRIVASGAVLRSSARLYAYVDYRGELEISAWVGLPEPDWMAPLNDGYPATTSVLPYGRQTYQVTKEDQHFEHLFNFVPKSGKGPVLLTLHSADTTLRNGNVRRTVEVRLDGQKAGELTTATSAHYLPVIDHADGMGRVVGVWGTITGSGLAAELTIKGAKSTELTDQWLRDMPLFPRLVPEAHTYDVPNTYQGKPKGKENTTRQTGPRSGSSAIARAGYADVAGLRADGGSDRVQGAPASRPGATSAVPAAPKKRTAPQPPVNPLPVRLSDTVVRLGEGSGPRRPVFYTVKGKQVFVDDRERSNAGKHPRRTAWIALVSITLLGLLLAGIPGIGPLLTIAALVIVFVAGPDQLRKASALEADRGGSVAGPLTPRDQQDREWGGVGEENQDPGDGEGA